MQKFLSALTTFLSSRHFWWSLLIFYLLTHLFQLTALPVFSDEAIYIRWAQLIMDEPARYLFFPLNDGKTPLFIWLLVPFQYLFSDQLLAGRFVSVLVGLLQMWVTVLLVKKLGGTRVAQAISAILVTILPFWYFHHRMALMDGLLTVFITVSVYAALALQEQVAGKRESIFALIFKPKIIALICLSALSIGAALWSKLPAVLAFPSLFMTIFYYPAKKAEYVNRFLLLVAACVGGLALFTLLKIHPAFSQLFARGSDFLHPVSDVLFKGIWQHTLPSIPNYISYFLLYLSIPVTLLPIIGSVVPHKHRRAVIILVLGALAFVGPIALLGKVVYPRYLLPAALFLTTAAALVFDSLLTDLEKNSKNKSFITTILVVSMLPIMLTSLQFMLPSLFNTNAIPFTPSDRVQYLTEWSSGHGLAQTTRAIQVVAKDKKIAVATEGHFGTLPDGILLYLHGKPVTDIWVEGIGQPVVQIPAKFAERALTYDVIWLVVNSHRMQLELPQDKLITEYCRPYNAPCLQVWDITEHVQ